MKKKKLVALICTAVMILTGLVGCSQPVEESSAIPVEDTATQSEPEPVAVEELAVAEEPQEEPQDAAAELSGTITMSGSTSMENMANAVAETFMAKYPGVTVTAEFTGSSAGIEAVLAGSVDIGNSSRALTEDEKAVGAVENIVAIDGIAVAVDPANTVADLSKDDLIGLFTGTVANWSELGGADAPVVVVGREAGSGTRGAFEELLEIEDVCNYASELDSTGAVVARVASTPGAIGYVSLDAVDDSIRTMALEGVEATVDNVKAGTYFLSRPFVMATVGEISGQSENVQALFAYLASEEGMDVIRTVGLITVD